MINFDKILSNLSILHGEAQNIITPVELVRDMVYSLPEKGFADPDETFFDPHCGKGTFLVVIAERCFYAMQKVIPDEKERIKHIVSKKLYGMDKMSGQVRTTITTLRKLAGKDVSVNIFLGDAMAVRGKKYNTVVGNPPYNFSNKKTGNGTGGDVTVYKKFYASARKVCKENGTILYVTPKGIIPVLEEDKLDVNYLNLMTEKNYWQYNTCWFFANNKKSSRELVINDKIISKIFEIKGNPNWYELNGKPNANKLDYKGENGIKAIVKLGSANVSPVYTTVDPTWKKLLGPGPKLAATLLENKHSYIITEDPICAEFCGVYKTNTLEQATKLKLFVDNSELLKSISLKLKTKGLFWTLRHLKPFDLDQILKGNEVPKEWSLTDIEVKELLK